jgi:hypothetical protein
MQDFHPSRYVGTRISSRLIFSVPQRQGEKFVFEYFSFSKTLMM